MIVSFHNELCYHKSMDQNCASAPRCKETVNSSYKFPIISSYKIPKSQSLRKLEDFKYAEYGGMVIDKRITLSRL